MKKKFYLLATTMLLCFVAFNSNAATVTDNNNATSKEAAANMTPQQKEVRLEEINARVQEIKAMDKSQLNKEDRRELRAELKSMKKESRAMGGGIYLSVGAIIIIILVLILIL